MNNREEENLTFSQLFEHASRQPEFRQAIKEQKQEENLADMIANLPQATPKSAQEVLDLHGHTVEESKEKARQFVLAGRAAGLRRVRVICGMGRHSEDGRSKLRPAVVLVLNELAQEQKIKEFRTAEPKDGGYGALEVIIK